MIDIQSSMEYDPYLSKEDIGAIEEAGSKLHQTNFMSHIFKDQGRQGLKLERACH